MELTLKVSAFTNQRVQSIKGLMLGNCRLFCDVSGRGFPKGLAHQSGCVCLMTSRGEPTLHQSGAVSFFRFGGEAARICCDEVHIAGWLIAVTHLATSGRFSRGLGSEFMHFSAFSHGFSPDPVGRVWPKWELSSNKKSDFGTPLVCKRVCTC